MNTPIADDDFDELPPAIGERMRDAFQSIFRGQAEAAEPTPENTHEHG